VVPSGHTGVLLGLLLLHTKLFLVESNFLYCPGKHLVNVVTLPLYILQDSPSSPDLNVVSSGQNEQYGSYQTN
jgi:hypothetical protein